MRENLRFKVGLHRSLGDAHELQRLLFGRVVTAFAQPEPFPDPHQNFATQLETLELYCLHKQQQIVPVGPRRKRGATKLRRRENEKEHKRQHKENVIDDGKASCDRQQDTGVTGQNRKGSKESKSGKESKGD
ncbi:unnamed protein product [Calypogeia fissa]